MKYTYSGARELIELGGMKVAARVKYKLPDDWDRGAIYAVFRCADGTLKAFRAVYDENSGTLTFETDLTGVFALVSFPFDGTPFSPAFYAALSELDVIRALPVRR